MRLKGVVEITIFDENEIKYHTIQNNLIPDNSWIGVLGNDASNNYFGSRSISIATDSRTPVASVFTVLNVIGTCTPTIAPIFVENVDPPYGTITGQIAPVGISRIFYTVALTGLSPADSQSIASTTGYAILLLDIPCTQAPGDYVNITYTIQFADDIGDGFLNKKLNRYDLARALFGFGGYGIGHLDNCFCNPYLSAIRVPVGVQNIAQSNSASSTQRYWTSSGVDATNFRWNYEAAFDRTIYIGRIINALTQGIDNTGTEAYALSKHSYDKEPFQTGFKHASGSTIPFFDSANIAVSQGTTVMAGTWTNKIPEFYKFTITLTGATGVATYKFSILKHCGFIGNTYSPLQNQTLYRTPGYQFVNALHGWKEEDFDIQYLSETEIVQFDITGVSVVDIFDGTNTTYDVLSDPTFVPTNIRQIAVDTTNRIIYVACRDTGLWTIAVGTSTITNIFTQPCYGVDVGRNDVAIAIINGGMYQSTDWATPVSFTFAGITDGNWSNVHFLKADPENVNDQIAIVADNGSGTNRVVWYQFSDNSAVLGYQNASVRSYPASLDVSDTASLWVIYTATLNANKITYGANTLGTSFSPFGKSITHSIYGTDTFSKVSFYQDSYISAIGLVGGMLTATYPITFLSGSTPSNIYCINMVDGVCVMQFSNNPSTNNRVVGCVMQILPSIATINYGWDGTNWVNGSSASKVTHTSTDALINGLTIAFADGTSTPQWVMDEFITQGINYGQLQDNATSQDIRRAWYSKPMHNETITSTTIALTVTLPAGSNPAFRRLDTDQYQGHRFYIDGTLATKVWLDGTAPAVSEVSIQVNGSATISFNAGDVGKSLTGNYIWIEF